MALFWHFNCWNFYLFCRNDGLFEIAKHIKTEFDRNYHDNFSGGRWNCLVVPVGVASGLYYYVNVNTEFIFAIGELHIVMWRNSNWDTRVKTSNMIYFINYSLLKISFLCNNKLQKNIEMIIDNEIIFHAKFVWEFTHKQ